MSELISIDDAKNIEFKKSVRGYSTEEVDRFVSEVVATLEQNKKEKVDLVKKLDILAKRIEQYRKDEENVRGALINAEKVKGSAVKEAELKVSSLLEEAKAEAKRIIYDANMSVEDQKTNYLKLQADAVVLREQLLAVYNHHIKMLEDEYVLIDDSFYVAGRLDAEKPGVSTGNADQEIKRKPLSDVLKGVDKTKPIIMIDHEPRELPETARAGVDLDISGHTHNGQFFPLNLTQYFIWPNPYGIQLYSKNGEEIDAAKTAKGKYGDPETEHIDTMTSFVTSGAGVYGPNMRVGTDSEVVRLEVTFRK